MKKLAALASVVVLSTAAGSAFAATVDVSATFSATISGTGSGTQTGTATGTYDTVTQVLNLDTTYTVVNTGLFSGTMDQTGVTNIDFSAMSGTNTVTTCTNVKGLLCGFTPVGSPQALSNIAGTWQSFTDTSTYLGATTAQSWNVTAVSAVPLPATAWLFGSALLGLTGIVRRRSAKS